MITRILIPVLFLLLAVPYAASAADAGAPSIRVLSPNGGEQIEIKSRKNLVVTWEAANVPQGSRVCIAITPKRQAGAYSSLAPHTDSLVANTFGKCAPAKNGKGKASKGLLDVYKSALYTPGEYVAEVTLFSEKTIRGTDYQGQPYTTTKADRLAYDASDSIITIKPFTDKKAALLTIYVGTDSWEGGVVLEKDAKATCLNQGAVDAPKNTVRCVWKGKEIYNSLAKEKKVEKKKKVRAASTPQADAEKAIADAEQEIAEVKKDADRSTDDGARASAAATLAVADMFLAQAKQLYGSEKWTEAKTRARGAEEQAFQAGSLF